MTLVDLLRHQVRQRLRSSTRGRDVLGAVLVGLAALYFVFIALALGTAFPGIAADLAPQQAPLTVLNEGMLSLLSVLLATRFLIQRSAGSDVQPYLTLPVRRGRLAVLAQVATALSWVNVVALVAAGALLLSTVRPAASAAGTAGWAGAVGGGLLATEALNTVLRAAWIRRAWSVLAVAGVVGGGLLVGGAAGLDAAYSVSGWLFGGAVATRPFPLFVLGAGTLGACAIAQRVTRRQLGQLVDRDLSPGKAAAARFGAGLVDRLLPVLGSGRVARLLRVDLLLILRNRRPRQMLLFGLPIVGVLLFQIITTGVGRLGTAWAIHLLLITGFLGITYGQYAFAWHGHHFDRLMSSGLAGGLVTAHWLTTVALCVLNWGAVLPVLLWWAPTLVLPATALLLYNTGIAIPIVLGIGLWNRTALDLDVSASFNHQGASVRQFLLVVPVLGIPVGVSLATGFTPMLWIVGGVGGVVTAAAPYWLPWAEQQLHRRRYALGAGFREA
jgi:hypothetical protein